MNLRPFLIPLMAVAAGGCLYDAPDANSAAIGQALVNELVADATGSCSLSASNGQDILIVRATSQTTRTCCSLSTGARVECSASGWDMSFQRFRYGTNGGVSGSGNGAACRTSLTDPTAVLSLSQFVGGVGPECPNLVSDVQLEGESGGVGGAVSVQYSGSDALREWFTYNIFTHILTAKSDVYIVRSGDGSRFYRLQFFDYYNAAGVSGYPQLRFAQIAP